MQHVKETQGKLTGIPSNEEVEAMLRDEQCDLVYPSVAKRIIDIYFPMASPISENTIRRIAKEFNMSVMVGTRRQLLHYKLLHSRLGLPKPKYYDGVRI